MLCFGRCTTFGASFQNEGGSPEGSGGVDDVQGGVSKTGLSVGTPGWLLSIAVAVGVAGARAVAITLHTNQHSCQTPLLLQ